MNRSPSTSAGGADPDVTGSSAAEASSPRGPGAGLRLRLWLGCLAIALVGAAAVVVIAASLAPADAAFDPARLGIWPWTAASACLLVGIAVAMWLHHGIVGQARGVARALASGDPSRLRGLPASAGWGELSHLTDLAQGILAQRVDATRAAADLQQLRTEIERLTEGLGARPGVDPVLLSSFRDPIAPLAGLLETRLGTDERRLEDRRAAALALRDEMLEAIADARESAEQTERGFVEATALLTTIRELQRLSSELQTELDTGGVTTALREQSDAYRRHREIAAGAIRELVGAAAESVERLAAALGGVEEVSNLVQRLANRATLIGLQVVVDNGPREAEALHEDLRALAREVRELTDRTSERAREVQREIAAADERMRGMRERIAAQLEEAPPAAETPSRASAQTTRLLERVREMVQDAATKGERLSASGERASRAAERVSKALEEDAQALAELAGDPAIDGGTPRSAEAPPGLHVVPGEPPVGERARRESRKGETA